MADRANALIKLHEDVPLFREAIAFTAAKTGFNAPVIEKDYFCTVLLWDFARHGGADLIFKGGTCLAKVHVGWGSKTTTAPLSILGVISPRLASNRLTWPIGLRGVAPQKESLMVGLYSSLQGSSRSRYRRRRSHADRDPPAQKS